MECRCLRGWGLFTNAVFLAASGLAEKLGLSWVSLSSATNTSPSLPDNVLRLISLSVGGRSVAQQFSRRPSSVVVIVSPWKILALGTFVRQARPDWALRERLSREETRRRVRRGQFGESVSEGPPELNSDSSDEESRLRLQTIRQFPQSLPSAGGKGRGRGRGSSGVSLHLRRSWGLGSPPLPALG